jgi:ankyrin repeat protein
VARVRALLTAKSGAASVELRDSDGRTALLWAADRGHTELARILVQEFKADVNAKVTIACKCTFIHLI